MTDEEKLAERYVNGIPIFAEEGEGFSRTQMQQAYLAGLKAGKPQWHKVADGDLPKHEVNVLVLHNVQCIDIAHYNYDYKEWHFTDSIVREVIAWCEIPKYTKE
jgi:hypothetical protein